MAAPISSGSSAADNAVESTRSTNITVSCRRSAAEGRAEALEEAIGKHGKPEIFNSDQGSQFTSEAFTSILEKNGIAISMDGKGSWRDNVFVERLWRSVKYEEVYLKAYDTVAEARASLSRYLDFFNRQRPHSSLDRKTPDEAYFTPRPFAAAA